MDGDVVWTSPITKGTVKENAEVSTESGSKYYLSAAPLEEVKEESSAAPAAAPRATPSANPQKAGTMRTPPEDLAAALKEISSKVKELESSLAFGGSRRPTGPSSRKQKIDVVLGAQWGDEGKGKLVDILSQVSRNKFGNFFRYYPFRFVFLDALHCNRSRSTEYINI